MKKLLLMTSIWCAAASSVSAAVVPPFNVEAQRAAHGEPNRLMRVTCPRIPKPILKIDTNSVYEQKDKTRSHIDEEARKLYLKKITPVRDYINRIAKLANAYVEASPAHPELAMCTLRWMRAWAQRDAFSKLTTKQAKMGFGTTLSALALSYAQVKDEPSLGPEAHEQIRKWLDTLAKKQIAYFEAHDSSNSSHANHRYWGGLGVAAVGVALDKKPYLLWGIDSAQIGIDQITEEGILPRELARGQKARDYHIYATAPLVMLAEIAAANGIDLYKENDGALHRLVATTLHALDDPSLFEEKTITQMIRLADEKVMAGRLAWLEIYHSRFPSLENETRLNQMRPTFNSSLGGNTTLLFSK